MSVAWQATMRIELATLGKMLRISPNVENRTYNKITIR
jgi:hypothetical protein